MMRVISLHRHQYLILLHAVARSHFDARYNSFARALELVLHLHAFEDDEVVALLHGLALGYRHGDDQAGHGGFEMELARGRRGDSARRRPQALLTLVFHADGV